MEAGKKALEAQGWTGLDFSQNLGPKFDPFNL